MKVIDVEIDHVATDESESITHVVLTLTMEDETYRTCDVTLPRPDTLEVPGPLREPPPPHEVVT